jgi:hypothetical protein
MSFWRKLLATDAPVAVRPCAAARQPGDSGSCRATASVCSPTHRGCVALRPPVGRPATHPRPFPPQVLDRQAPDSLRPRLAIHPGGVSHVVPGPIHFIRPGDFAYINVHRSDVVGVCLVLWALSDLVRPARNGTLAGRASATWSTAVSDALRNGYPATRRRLRAYARSASRPIGNVPARARSPRRGAPTRADTQRSRRVREGREPPSANGYHRRGQKMRARPVRPVNMRYFAGDSPIGVGC